jgi:outer membrane murein-binding lipoprotein Lpp
MCAWRKASILAATVSLHVLLSGCVRQSEHDKVVAEAERLRTTVVKLETESSMRQSELARLNAEMKVAQDRLASAFQENGTLQIRTKELEAKVQENSTLQLRIRELETKISADKERQRSSAAEPLVHQLNLMRSRVNVGISHNEFKRALAELVAAFHDKANTLSPAATAAVDWALEIFTCADGLWSRKEDFRKDSFDRLILSLNATEKRIFAKTGFPFDLQSQEIDKGGQLLEPKGEKVMSNFAISFLLTCGQGACEIAIKTIQER